MTHRGMLFALVLSSIGLALSIPAACADPTGPEWENCDLSLPPETIVAGCTRALGASRTKQDKVMALSWRAEAHRALKRYDAALADIEAALKLEPERSLYYDRAAVYRDLKRYPEALADYDRLIALKPDNLGYHYQRGITHEQAGHIDQAIADLEKALSLKPVRATLIDIEARLARLHARKAK